MANAINSGEFRRKLSERGTNNLGFVPTPFMKPPQYIRSIPIFLSMDALSPLGMYTKDRNVNQKWHFVEEKKRRNRKNLQNFSNLQRR